MKKISSALLLSLVVLLSFTFKPTTVKSQDNKMPKYGLDSINCIMNLSLYTEFYKQKNYDDAIVPWSVAYRICPRCSKNIYIHGEKIMKYRIKKAKDKTEKQLLVDTLLSLYDQRIKYFNQKGFVLGRKASSLLRYRPTQFEEAHKYCNQSCNLRGVKTEAQVLVLDMQTTVALYKAEKISQDSVVETYSRLLDIIDAKIKAKNKESDKTAKSNIDIYFDKSGAATCESLVSLFDKRFEATPEDVDLLKKITSLLDKTGCTDSKLFVKSSEQLNKLEPSAISAYMLAKLFLKKQEYSNATKYYLEAINLQEDSIRKSKYYYELGILTHSQQSNPELARSYAYKAIKLNPKDGKPYLLIGNIYAASAKSCGENDFEHSAVYWVAVDKFIQAKKVDPSIAEEAKKSIETYSKYFPDKETSFFHEVHEGNTYKVGCWINENTIARF